MQAHGASTKDPDDAGGVTALEDGAPAPLVDPDGTHLPFTAKIADAGAPDPCTLVEATRSPDQPPEEEPIDEKTDALNTPPVVQGFSQMSGVDTHAKVACVVANLGHPHWEAVERTLHHLPGTQSPYTRPTIHTHRGKQPIGGPRKRKFRWQHGQVPACQLGARVPHRRPCHSLVLEASRHHPLQAAHH
jgi:hypothetical protein